MEVLRKEDGGILVDTDGVVFQYPALVLKKGYVLVSKKYLMDGIEAGEAT